MFAGRIAGQAALLEEVIHWMPCFEVCQTKYPQPTSLGHIVALGSCEYNKYTYFYTASTRYRQPTASDSDDFEGLCF